jgi:hypothetical protein
MRWTIRAKLTGLVRAVLLPLMGAAAVKFWLEVEQGREDGQADVMLYDEAHPRLRHLDSLRQVVEQILVPISLEERLNLIARKAAELFGADRAAIALRAGDRDELVVRAGHALAQGEVGRVLQPGVGVMSVVASGRADVLVNE